MLTKIHLDKSKITGRLFLLPLIAALAALFAFKNDFHKNLLTHQAKKIKIVLDPGHGGNNGGATVNGIREQDFNLELAKKIRDVAKSYDVDIVLTREGDNTPEPEQTLRSSLEYRTKFASESQADAFISIHMNSNDLESGIKTQSGFEIYISKKAKRSSEQYKQSVKLGSTLNAALAKDYKTGADLIERDKGIYILDNATIPAVLVECGSMDVKEDMEFMSLPANQEKIARDIIEGVIKFSSSDTGVADPISVSHGPDPGNQPSSIPEDSTPALKKVEVQSQYPGGQLGWQKYLQKNLRYPDAAIAKEIQGMVMVQFIVRADGYVDSNSVKTLSGPKELREESIRVIKHSGNWLPARDHGVAVNAYKQQPISYKLEAQ